MTEREKLMYEILGQISSANAPIIFKGGLITQLILSENGFTSFQRATVDIDANWVDAPPSMDKLTDTIVNALGVLNDQFSIEPSREYGENKSAGLNILDKASGLKILSMDIDIKPLSNYRTYYFGEMKIKGVLANEILADKICTVSSDLVYKHRAKDLIDIYALAQCTNVNTTEIYETIKSKDKEIQSFNGLLSRKSDVQHAYSKLKRIENKPTFDKMYSYLCNFLKPFIQHDLTEKIWVPSQELWKQSKALEKAPFSRAKLKAAAQSIEQQSGSDHGKSKVHKKDDPSL